MLSWVVGYSLFHFKCDTSYVSKSLSFPSGVEKEIEKWHPIKNFYDKRGKCEKELSGNI